MRELIVDLKERVKVLKLPHSQGGLAGLSVYSFTQFEPYSACCNAHVTSAIHS